MKTLRLLLTTTILATASVWANPVNLPVSDGLQVWLDADSGVFLFEVNQAIAWADLSGNNNDAIYNDANTFGELPPLYNSSNPEVGGAATVRFNGSNALELDLSLLVDSDYTIFVVNGRDRFGLANFFIAGDSVATNQNLVLGYEEPDLLRQSHFANDLDAQVEGYFGEPVWSIDTFRYSGADGKDLFHNGEAVASDDITTPLLANTGTTIGHFRAIPGFFFQGDIAEILVYDRALTPAERQLVEADLAERYNLPLIGGEPVAPGIERDALLGIEVGEDGLIWIDPENGLGNPIGTTVVAPVESLAKDPFSGILYGGTTVNPEDPVPDEFLYDRQTIVEVQPGGPAGLPSGIDAVVIDWISPVVSGLVSESDLTYLSFTFLSGATNLGSDIAIIDGIVQPIGGAARDLSDIEFDFDLDAGLLVQVRNAFDATMGATSGTQFQVQDNVTIPSDGQLILAEYDNGDLAALGIGTDAEQATSLLRTEGPASLFTFDERDGSATRVGSFGAGILGMRAADFDAEGTLWAVVDVENIDDCVAGVCSTLESLATVDTETGEANVLGSLFTDGLNGIAFDGNGTLWGVSSTNDGLYIIEVDGGDVFTEFISTLFVGGGGPIPAGGFRSLQFACDNTPFDGELGTLYAGLGDDDGSGGGALYVVDTETGSTFPVSVDSATGGSSLSALALHTTCGETISQSPTPQGEDIKVITVEAFEQVADNVVQAGLTDAFFCVLPDTRWSPDGSGGYNFTASNLNLGSLAGQGTCSGPLVPGELETWEADVFPNLNLVVPAYIRSYLGRLTLPGAGPTEGHWLALGVVRSTAEFDGPVTYVTFPEALIDYSATDPAEIPACDQDLAFRNLDIGGAVPAFGDFANFEGNRMIIQSAQCNRTRSMTRRTTHVFPVRYEYPIPGPRGEVANIYSQLSGIRGTIIEASSCADPSLLADIQASLSNAQNAIRFGNFDDAEEQFEEIARSAKNAENFGTGFSACDVQRNYRGNFMSRGITAAFTMHDRFQHPVSYVKYFVPADLDVPILDSND